MVDYEGDSEEEEETTDSSSAIEMGASEVKAEIGDLNTSTIATTTDATVTTVDAVIASDSIDEEVESPNKRAKLA